MSRSSAANLSTASLEHDVSGDAETVAVKNYYKELLKSRIFLGRYLERRLINERVGYRDIVLISPAEVELKRDLLEAQHKLQLACPKTYWIGITDSESVGCGASGVCLWTEIENQPFGPFWFQVKSIKLRVDEIIVSLKCLRHISDAFLELEPILTGSIKKIKDTSNTNLDNSVPSNETYNEIVGSLKGVLSITNLKEFITFFCAFIIAIFTGSTSFVNFLGNFILALIREISIFVKNSTPMFLGILDFFSKIVGGFYILLAMFFRQNTPTPVNKRAVAYYDRQSRTNHYDDRQFD